MHLPLTSIQPAGKAILLQRDRCIPSFIRHDDSYVDLRVRLTHWPSFSRIAPPLFVFKWPYETFPRGVNLRTSFLLKVPVLLLEMNPTDGHCWWRMTQLKQLWHTEGGTTEKLCFIPLRWAILRWYKQKMCRTEKDTHTHTHTLNFWHNTWRRTVSSRLQTACQRSWTVTNVCIISLCGREIWAVTH